MICDLCSKRISDNDYKYSADFENLYHIDCFDQAKDIEEKETKI